MIFACMCMQLYVYICTYVCDACTYIYIYMGCSLPSMFWFHFYNKFTIQDHGKGSADNGATMSPSL